MVLPNILKFFRIPSAVDVFRNFFYKILSFKISNVENVQREIISLKHYKV